MLEAHAFGDFVPDNAKYLILGSFPTKDSHANDKYDWFYANGRNQFWPILEQVYGIELPDKASKQSLCRKLGIAMSDIILSCSRSRGSSMDNNLTNITYNTEGIIKLISGDQSESESESESECECGCESGIECVYFTSRYVEKTFRKLFGDKLADWEHVELITLPSPSPRYARMSLDQKIVAYRQLLPQQQA